MEIQYRDRDEFVKWLRHLSPQNRARVGVKLTRLKEHGPGIGMPLVRRIDADLYERRVDKFRLYFTVGHDTAWFVVFGDKDSQQRDIARAKERM